MKVLVLYRPNSEYARSVEEFVHRLEDRLSRTAQLEVMNYDSRDGNATASLYDVMQQPAVLVLRDDGAMQKSWVGEQMPMADEVMGYARA